MLTSEHPPTTHSSVQISSLSDSAAASLSLPPVPLDLAPAPHSVPTPLDPPSLTGIPSGVLEELDVQGHKNEVGALSHTIYKI